MPQTFEIAWGWSVSAERFDDHRGAVLDTEAASQRRGDALVKTLGDGIVLQGSHSARTFPRWVTCLFEENRTAAGVTALSSGWYPGLCALMNEVVRLRWLQRRQAGFRIGQAQQEVRASAAEGGAVWHVGAQSD